MPKIALDPVRRCPPVCAPVCRFPRARLTPVARALLGACLLSHTLASLPAHAAGPVLPSGLQVVQGQASALTQGTQLTVRNTPNAILNWQSFSIGAGNRVYFDQASAASKVLNRVVGSDPSQILGSLASNGQVWLLNPNGVLFGQGARVDVASLVTSTLRLGDSDFLAGRYSFSAAGAPAASVRNAGSLRSSFGGQIVLLGGSVENTGDIQAPGGQVTLTAASSVQLVDTGLPNLAVRVDVPAGEVVNLGRLLAAGGKVDVYGAIVNQQGVVAADSLSLGAQGQIVLQAADTLTLGADSRTTATGAGAAQGGDITLTGRDVTVLGQGVVDASGAAGGGRIRLGGGQRGQDASVPNAQTVQVAAQASISADALDKGDGGQVTVWADDTARVNGHISARGGVRGGDGGFVETSGKRLLSVTQAADVSAPLGRGGTWLLDPYDITVVNGSGTLDGGTPNFTGNADNSTVGSNVINAALDAGNNVVINTGSGGTQSGDITLAADITKSSGAVGNTLTLIAGRNILFNSSNIATNSGTLNLNLVSDQSNTGTGATIFTGSSVLNLQGGTLSATANGGRVTLNNAFLTIAAGVANIGSLTMTSATLDSSALVAVTGTFTATASFLQGTGGLATAGNSTVTDFTFGGNWTNGGTLTVNTAPLVFGNGGASGTLTNTPSGVVVLDNGAALTRGGGGTATFVNDGTVNVTGNTNITVSLDSLTNTGTVNLLPGSQLTLQGVNAQGGGSINLNAATLSLSGASVSNAVNFSGAGGVIFNIAGSSAVAGDVTLGAGPAQLTVSGSGTGLTISGAIRDSGVPGSVQTDSSGGPITFANSANNSYTGTTVVNTGELIVNAPGSAFSPTARLTVNNGATLTLQSAIQNVGSLAGDGSISLGTGASLVFGLDNTNSTWSGTFSGQGGWTKQGTGTFNLAGAANNSGNTEIRNGALVLQSGGSLSPSSSLVVVGNPALLDLGGTTSTVASVQLDGGGTIANGTLTSGSDFDLRAGTVSAVLAGNVGVNKTTTGTVTFSGANTYTGTTVVSAGELALVSGAALGGAGAGATVATGATLHLDGVTLVAGPLTLAGAGVGGVGALEVTQLSGTGSVINGDTLLNGNVVIGNSGDLTLQGNVIGGGSLTKTGVGQLNLAGAGSYSGSTTIAAGTLNVQAGNALPAQNPVNLADGATLLLNSSASVGALSGTPGARVDLNGNALTVGSDGSSAIFSGVISGAAAGSNLVKTGSGSFTLTGASLFTGSTSIEGGALILSGAGAQVGAGNGVISIAGASQLGLANAATVTNPIVVAAGGSIAAADASTATVNGAGLVLSGTATLAAGAGALVVNAPISESVGSSSLITSGTVTLTAANSYSGGTAISQGALRITNGNALGSGQAAVGAGAALELQGNLAVPNALVLAGLGVGNTGALRNISGDNTINGPVTLGSATRVNADAGSLTLTSPVPITGTGSDLQFGGSLGASITVQSAIATDFGGLVKDGDITLTLTGANTFTGTTTVFSDNGRLVLSGFNAALAGPLAINGGRVEFNNTNPITLPSLAMTGGWLAGTGDVNVTGAFTVSGTSAEITGSGVLTTLGASSVDLGGVVGGFLGVSKPWVNRGTFTLGGDDFLNFGYSTGNGGTLTNAPEGVVNIVSTAAVAMDTFGGGGTTVNNAGVLNAAQSGRFNLSAFNNSGIVSLGNGSTLAINAPGTDSGQYTVPGGATLQFAGGLRTLDSGSSISGAGSLLVSDGAVTINGSLGLTNPAASIQVGIGGFTPAPVLTLGDAVVGTLPPIVVQANGTLVFNNTSPVVVPSGSLSFATLGGSGNVTITGALDVLDSFSTLTGTGTLTTQGVTTLRVSAADGLRLSKPWINSGTVQVINDSVINFGIGGVLINAAGGVINLQGTTAAAIADSTGSGIFSNLGTLNATVGGSHSIAVGTFSNSGTVNVSAGTTLTLNAPGTDTGLYTVAGGATLDFAGGDRTLAAGSNITGAGTLSISGAQLTVNGALDLANTGTAINFSGTGSGLVLNGSLSGNVVPVSITATNDDATAFFNNASTVTLASLTLGNAVLAGSGGVTVAGAFNLLPNSALRGTGVFTTLGTTTTSSGGRLLVNKGWVNAGTLNLSGGVDFPFSDEAGNVGSLTNAAGGVINVSGAGDVSFEQFGGLGAFTNAGTLNHTSGAALSIALASVTNSGSINVNAGTVNLSGGTDTDSGIYTVAAGGTLQWSGGTRTLGAGASVSGAGSVQVSGGATTVNFSGAAVNLTGASGALVLSSGTLNVNNALVLPSLRLDGGTLAGAGDITVAGALDAPTSSVVLTGAGSLITQGTSTVNMSDTNGVVAVSKPWTNTGALLIGGDSAVSFNGSTFTNAAAGTVNLASTAPQPLAGSAGAVVNNAGVLNQFVAGTAALSVPVFNNTGVVNVNAGTLAISGDGSDTGTYAIAAGSVLNFSGGTRALNFGSSVTGAGATQISGGAVFINAAPLTFRQLDLTGGTLAGSGSLVVTTAFSRTAQASISPGLNSISITQASGDLTPGALSAFTIALATQDAAGTLLLDGALTSSGNLSIAAAGSLRQVGALTAGGALALSGTSINLGNSVNALRVQAAASAGLQLSAGASLVATETSGDSITLDASAGVVSSGVFTNLAGASALNTAAGARWLVHSTNPVNDTVGGLAATFRQYGATLGVTVPAAADNGLLYAFGPSLSFGLQGSVTKVYDGTAAASLAPGNYQVVGAVAGDTITLGNATVGSYAEGKNVGTGKTVLVSGITATATDSASGYPVYGYSVFGQASGTVGTITAAPLTVSASSVDRVYNGSTAVNVNLGAVVPLAGDVVSLASSAITGAYANKNAGLNKPITVGTISLQGADAGNYTAELAPGLTGNVTTRPLDVSGVSAASKVYDATVAATLAGTAVPGSALVSGDLVAVAGAPTATFSNKNVGTGKAVTVSGYTLSGADAANYTLAQPTGLTADITQLALQVSGISANNKVYDATPLATLAGTAAVGALGGDAVTVAGAPSASFANKNAGTGKAVTISGYTLSGADAANYTLTQPTGLTADITQLALQVSGISANNKVYDATPLATLAGTAVVSALGGDAVTVAGAPSASFANKNVGAGKAVTVSGYSLSGADAANYTLTQPTGLTADITQLALQVSGISANNKVYDATPLATLAGTAVVSALGGDAVTVAGAPSASFANKNAGTGKAVTVSGYTLSGADAANYTLNQPTGLTADITQLALQVSGISANNKVYDATPLATLAGTAVVSALGGDAVTVAGAPSASFANKNAGAGKAVTVSGYTLSGTDAANYTLAQPTGLTADITQLALQVSGISANNKVYDATPLATLAGTAVVSALGGDAVTVAGAPSASFANKNVGAGKAVTVSGYTLSGADAANYTLAQPTGLTADITQLALQVSGISANNKVYDATPLATLAGTAVVSALAGDAVTVAGAPSASFANKNAGAGKAVTVRGYTLSGADAANYSVLQPTGLSADITQLALQVSGISANNKVYDTTPLATLAGTAVVSALGGDAVTVAGAPSASFANKNVGTGKAVTVGGYTLSGADAANYTLTQPTGLTADITQLALQVSGISANNKVYDATPLATLAGTAVVSALGGDAVTVAGAPSASFVNKNVGTGKAVTVSGYSLSGADAANYTLHQPTGLTANITQLALQVNGISANNKVYDATPLATLAGTAVVSALAGDAVTVAGAPSASFANKNAGAGKAVTVGGYTLSGADAANYSLLQPTGLTANITQLALQVSGISANNKVYDATPLATLAGTAVVSALAGDAVTVAGAPSASFANKNAGTGKAVTVSGYTLSGADAANYSLLQPVGLAANIAPLALQLSGITANSKTYDATVAATLSGIALVVPLAGDSVVVTGAGSATFADKNVGLAKPLVVSGYALGGADAANYSLPAATGLSSDITPRALALANLGSVGKTYDGNTSAAVSGTLTGVLPGDAVDLGAPLVGRYGDKNVGVAKPVTLLPVALAGADAGNYTLTPSASLTADITPLTLTVTGLAPVGKVYDGTSVAVLSGAATVTQVAGDAVALVGAAAASFNDKNVGIAKPVTVTGLSVAGADAGNYALVQPTGLTASIAPRALTPLVAVADKVYDGSTQASASGSLPGAVAGDAVGLSLAARFADVNVGVAKPVAVQAQLTGSDAGNYTLSAGIPQAQASITPATLSYVATPVSVTVGDPLPVLTGSVAGFVAADTLANIATGTLAWTTPATLSSPAGRYAINGSGLVALNYVFVQSPANAAALVLLLAEVQATAVTVAAATNSTTTSNVTQTLAAVAVPVVASTPTTGRVLDAAQAMVNTDAPVITAASNSAAGTAAATTTTTATTTAASPGTAGEGTASATSSSSAASPATTATAAAAPAAAPQGGDAAAPQSVSYRSVKISEVPRDQLQSLLAIRASYKQSVLSNALGKLEVDPTLADVRGCTSPAELTTGNCLLTEALKQEIAAIQARAVVKVRKPAGRKIKQAVLPNIQRKLALLIGVNTYADKRVPQLDGAVPDARAMRDVLEAQLGYETTMVEDPTREELVRAFNKLALDADVNDSVVIYYAGHGVVVPTAGPTGKESLGYWLPADSNAEKPETWLSNADIARLVSVLGARQVLLISDSCYSGSLAGSERVQIDPKADAADLLTRKAVVVMSSGGNEPVSDAGREGHSVFTWYLMEGLKSVSNWQVGGSVFERVRKAVSREVPQTPQYGAARSAGHQGNTDYLFEHREIESLAASKP